MPSLNAAERCSFGSIDSDLSKLNNGLKLLANQAKKACSALDTELEVRLNVVFEAVKPQVATAAADYKELQQTFSTLVTPLTLSSYLFNAPFLIHYFNLFSVSI